MVHLFTLLLLIMISILFYFILMLVTCAKGISSVYIYDLSIEDVDYESWIFQFVGVFGAVALQRNI